MDEAVSSKAKHPPRLRLLATKLLIPRARQSLVARPHLVVRLNACLDRKVTLVSAPAGFGKTTLVSTWARGIKLPVAWLSLDEADNDPARFLSYLVAALQHIDSTVGQDVQDLRFTLEEASIFVREVMGLALDARDIHELNDRTEGWIAGLQLAGLSARDRENPSRYIATLSGSHRYILSYLTEEVLGRQTADIKSFLLQTSILDKLSGDHDTSRILTSELSANGLRCANWNRNNPNLHTEVYDER